jgi:hypothetical protein
VRQYVGYGGTYISGTDYGYFIHSIFGFGANYAYDEE